MPTTTLSPFLTLTLRVEREFIPRTDGKLGLRETGAYLARKPGGGPPARFLARQVVNFYGSLEGTHRLTFARAVAERICAETGASAGE